MFFFHLYFWESINNKFPTLFTKKKKERKTNESAVFNSWIYIIADSQIAGTVQEIERLSIWKLLELLEFLVDKNNKEREKFEKIKEKNKTKKRAR